jgi:hypothetical protein
MRPVLPVKDDRMQKRISDPLEIPAFLKRKKGEVLTTPDAPLLDTRTLIKKANHSLDLSPYSLAPETEALLRDEIKGGRFSPRWLDDPNTVFVFERVHQLRKAKKEAQEEEKLVERKIAKNMRDSLKQEFGINTRIIVLIREPKRQAGAARIPRFASLLEYLDKNPNASVAEIFKNTLYIKSDFLRDQRLKIIKTDLITAQPNKTTVTIAKGKKK